MCSQREPEVWRLVAHLPQLLRRVLDFHTTRFHIALGRIPLRVCAHVHEDHDGQERQAHTDEPKLDGI